MFFSRITFIQAPGNNLAQRIFEKIRYGLMGYSGAWGKLIHEKSLKKEA
jgi:hypothetical protein